MRLKESSWGTKIVLQPQNISIEFRCVTAIMFLIYLFNKIMGRRKKVQNFDTLSRKGWSFQKPFFHTLILHFDGVSYYLYFQQGLGPLFRVTGD